MLGLALALAVLFPALAVPYVDDWQSESALGKPALERLLEDPTGASGTDPRAAGDPRVAEALNALRDGRLPAAVQLAREAVAAAPKSAAAHEVLGAARALQGKTGEGLKALQEAVRLDPAQATAITKIGDIYRAQGKKAEAKKQYLEAIRLRPDDRFANQRLGLLAEEEGDATAAKAYLEKGIAGAPPDYVGVKVSLGRLYNDAGEYQRTIALLGPVVTGTTRNGMAHLVLGTAQLATGAVPDAVRSFELAKAVSPKDPGFRLALGIAYRGSIALEKSLGELAEANRLRPDWSTGLFQQGETLAAMGRYKEALGLYRRAEKLSKDPRLIRKRIGDTQLATKDYPGAVRTYVPLAAQKDAPYEVLDGLGTAYQLGGHGPEAEAVFKRIVETWPKDPVVYFRLGSFYGYRRDYAAALDTFARGLQLDPKNPTLLRALSLTQSRLGNASEAVRTAEQLVAGKPDDPERLLLLGIMLQEAGSLDRARDVYGSVLKRSGENVIALNNLAVVLSAQGRHEPAIVAARRAKALQPKDPLVADTLGWALFQAGQRQEALDALVAAAKLGPSVPVVHYHLGVVQQDMGKVGEAKASFKKALSLSAEFRDAADARSRLASLK